MGRNAAVCRTGDVVYSGDELKVVRGYAAKGYAELVVELGGNRLANGGWKLLRD
jgi:hypothetical protein